MFDPYSKYTDTAKVVTLSVNGNGDERGQEISLVNQTTITCVPLPRAPTRENNTLRGESSSTKKSD